MKKSTQSIYAALGIILLVIAGWFLFFHFFPPETIIEKIGINNVYLAAFLMASIGGFSSITGTSVYVALAGFAHSGSVNTLMLGIISGLGIFLSDSLFYFVVDYGRDMITKVESRWEKLFERVRRWMRVAPDWLVYMGVFACSAFAPIPNDILLAALVMSRYEYKRFVPYLFAGDLTAMILLTHVAKSVALAM